MSDWQELVEQWARDRKIIGRTEPRDQMLKLIEEFGELSTALQKNDRQKFIDAIGDCAVVLTIIAAQCGESFERCQWAAWDEIKDRKGFVRNGVFVKEAT